MYAKKHRPMQKLTAICLSVTIAAASLLSGHVFASDEAPQTDYLTGWELLAELREMGLGQDVILDEEAPESDNSSETNTEDPSDTTGEPGDGDQTDGTEPSNPDEGGSGEGDPDPGESTPEQPGDGDQTGGTEPGNPDEGGSGEGDTDTDTDPGTDNPDNSDPAAGTDPDQGDGTEQGADQNQPSAPAESTESASGEVPLVTQNDEDTADVIDPDKPETPESTEPASEPETPSQPESPSEPSSEPSSEPETPSQPESPSEPSSEPSSEPETPSQPEGSSEPSSEPESSEGELPETSGITEEQRAELEAYVQMLEAEQVLSLDDTDITAEEYDDLYSMLTDQQLQAIELYLNPPKIPQNVTTPEGLVETPEPVRPFRLMSLMAARNDTEPVKTDGLVTSKTATMNADGTRATIDLEAYVSGEMESSTESVPLDIVLVLDQSGSMADPFDYEFEVSYTPYEGHYLDSSNRPLFYKDGEKYYEVNVEVVNNGWSSYTFTYTYEKDGKIKPISINGGSNTVTGLLWGWGHSSWPIVGAMNWIESDSGLYTQTTNSTEIPRIDALKDSVSSFIEFVRTDAAETGAKHNIAIVGFASESGYGNNTEILSVEGSNSVWKEPEGVTDDAETVGVSYAQANRNEQYYEQALVDCGNEILDHAIEALATNGATRSDLGMEMAEKILEANPVGDSGRKQVVIMFTDGTPTTSNQFSTSVANGAVSHAGNMKDNDVTVYTIGIFDGAQPLTEDRTANNLSGEENQYMHAVSSNYPNATTYTNRGDSANTPPRSYYLSAGDADTLNTIFENIYHEIVTPSLELGSSAVLKDVVSDYFQLPDGFNAGDVTVEVWNATGNGETPTWVKTDQKLSATVDGTTKTVSVTGFDYSANAVVKNSNDEWQGKKLVVSFAVEPHDDFLGGNAVPTNDSESGVYDGNTVIENFDVPSVNVPIHYGFDVTDKTIYLSNSQAVNFGSGEVFYDGGISAILLGDTELANDYVDITYTVKRGTETIGTYTIRAGESTGSWGSTIPSLTPEDCEELTITCTVSPRYSQGNLPTGVEPPPEGSNYETAKSVSAGKTDSDGDGNVDIHVLKPTLNFHDTQLTGPMDNYSLTGNQKEDFIIWSDFETGHTNRPDPTQTEPADASIVLNYTWMGNVGTIGADNTVDLEETANFKVETITIGRTTYTVGLSTDATADYHVTSDCSYDDLDPSLEDEHVNGRHFTIHLPSEFDLTITKTLAEGTTYTPGETFRFKVSGEDFYAEFTLGDTESYPVGGWSITITGLKRGNYTIEEDTEWSWRYDCTTDSTQRVTADKIENNQAEVTFTNTKTNNHWLSWEDTIQNIFKAS